MTRIYARSKKNMIFTLKNWRSRAQKLEIPWEYT